MNRYSILISIGAFLIAGCSVESRIDGSSNVAFEASIKQVTGELDEATQEDFYAALDYLARLRMSEADLERTNGWNEMELTQYMMQAVRERVHGYTATEVIDEAIELRDKKK